MPCLKLLSCIYLLELHFSLQYVREFHFLQWNVLPRPKVLEKNNSFQLNCRVHVQEFALLLG